MISPKYLEEETKIVDLVKHKNMDELHGNTKKHADYTLQEEKVLDKSTLKEGEFLSNKHLRGLPLWCISILEILLL